jgi:hypothetical protein
MQKFLTVLPALMLVATPFAASAHAHASYDINGKQYDIVIGSLNEPIVVDDKTGLDLRITSGGRMMEAEDGDMEPVGGTPAVGLEQSLKVEMIAGGAKKIFDLSPVFNTPGSYKTTFYPTLPTTFSYRIFGELEGTPIDLTFTCRAEGETSVDEGEKQIAPGVKQLLKGGGFGCPSAKEDMGFPEASVSVIELEEKTGGIPVLPLAAVGLAALALAVGFRRK